MDGLVRVCCAACGALLTRTLRHQPIQVLNVEASGVASLPSGSLVIDPEAVTGTRLHRDGRVEQLDHAPAGAIVVRPDDLVDEAVTVSGVVNGCCGMDGLDGPNQSCTACGAVLGTAWTDCWTPHEVRFGPSVVELSAP